MIFLANLLVGLVLNIIAYLLTPQPKTSKPETVQDMDNPVAEAGKPIPVIFGTVTVKGLNVLWYGNKETRTIRVKP